MSKEKKEHRVISHLSNEELAERLLTPTDEWIVVPEGESVVEYFLRNRKEIEEAYNKKKKQDNG